jgi:hypothetical protein
MKTWWLVLMSRSSSDSATTVGEQRIPVLGCPVGGDRDGATFGDALRDQVRSA